jgi:cyclophilin family peptidyl-prolyl cis-trans isomerase
MRTSTVLLAAGVTLALTLTACGSSGSSSSNAACAKADGSSPKTQKFTAAPPMCLEKGKKYSATIETNHGTVHIALRDDIAPNTVNSFVNLARFHYFDATTCHRAVKSFVVQCGDPTATGTGGPGYEFPDELSKIEPYKVGSLAMANAGANTNGSQFFIITGTQGSALPPSYTLFGQVDAKDMGVVHAFDALANPADGPPISPIDIKSVTITVT